MEVVVPEEKKKIFRARKTMKVSDRRQLESLHSTLLTSSQVSSDTPGPTTTKDSNVELGKDFDKSLVPQLSTPTTDCTEPMDTDKDALEEQDAEAATTTIKGGTSLKATTSNFSQTFPSRTLFCVDQENEIKKEDLDKQDIKKQDFKKTLTSESKMELESVKVEAKNKKLDVFQTTKPFQKDKTTTTPGLKRTLSEGNGNDEKDEPIAKRELKRPKMQNHELEAKLELKITAKAGAHPKLEKVVQQLVEQHLRALQLNIFDQHFKELKDRIDKIDCAAKHQTAVNTLQSKITRLAKKFGEANQELENKKKQEDLQVVAAAVTAKTTTTASSPQRPVRTSLEVKQPAVTVSSSSPPAPAPVPVPTSTAMVIQAPVLQLITSTSNAASPLPTALTSQNPTGTLLLKTTPGSNMMATGQPLLIQLPLSVANGQTGTLVNIPVSSFSAASSLNKAKTTSSTTAFLIKPASAVPSAPVSAPVMSVARAVFQGGNGGICTPSAGISVSTARTPAQPVSVAGAMSSVSSPATSGPAATGSTAPGPPQGTSLTSKTGSILSKVSTPAARPKGSVIDLTEDDDDDVQVTGVKNAKQSELPSSFSADSPPAPPTGKNVLMQSTSIQDSPLISRTNVATPPSTRGLSVTLPPLPSAPAPQRPSPEAEKTSPPQQPQLKLVSSPTGIVLSWCVAETDQTCAPVDSYHLYAFHQDNSNNNAAQQHWKKIGVLKALPLPMACTLTQFQSGSTYYFAVRAKDVHGRFGPFCKPQCTNVISSSPS
uniref:Activating transcription factor 7 interacting protein n=1 Tax=Tetraodon nigroviridis TaxID=99883 RepID=H3BZM1_TETNG